MAFSSKFVLFFSMLAAVANADFKAGVDETAEERERYGFGSLIKDKGAVLHNIFSKNVDDSDKLKAGESVKKDKGPFEKTWSAVVAVIEKLPLKKLDEEKGEIETKSVNIETWDSTGTCKYQLIFKVEEDGKFLVKVSSEEDSKQRIQKFQEQLVDRINKILRENKELANIN